MRIKKVILENYRAYRNKIEVDFNDLTVFIGKNDIGKSSILEALDIFFNNGKGVIKMEKDDLNKSAEKDGQDVIKIGVIFSDFPDEIIVDSRVRTSLQDEYLLNKDGDLEIHKSYKNGTLISTEVFAYHPANDEIVSNLLTKKISELKNVLKEKNIPCENKAKSSIIRKSIRESYSEIIFEDILIGIDQDGLKQIWGQINRHMPIYVLFQSDRANNETDPEVQDPLKFAVQEILKQDEIQTKLKEVAEEVERISNEVAESTLMKLNELNPEIAKSLSPNLPDPTQLKWADVFKKISITSDNDIPLNKRGSGVRRLVLISFFAAQAERKRKDEEASNVIYAIEEPETSQHPDHQRYLIESLIDLSSTGNTQVIVTTHHPATAQMLPTKSLNFVTKDDSGSLIVKTGSDDILLEIASTLGILPSIGKLIVCVEGENDRTFLMNINSKIKDLNSIVNLEHKFISVVPMKGSNLKSWINRNYLQDSNVVEFHLYDRDNDEKYKNDINDVNTRADKSFGVLTKRSEMENYIPNSLYKENVSLFGNINFDCFSDWENGDIPKFIVDNTSGKEDKVKELINKTLSRNLTKSLLEEDGSWQEVESWFKKIKELLDLCIPKNNQ